MVVAAIGTIVGCITAYLYLDRRSQRHERMVKAVLQTWTDAPSGKEFDVPTALAMVAPSSEPQPGNGLVGWLGSTTKLIGPHGSLGLPTRGGRLRRSRGANSEGS